MLLRAVPALLTVLLGAACAGPEPTPTQSQTSTFSPGPSGTPSTTPTVGPSASPTTSSQPTPTPTATAGGGLELTLVADTGGENLTFVTHAGDGSGRLFLVEQVGRIRILDAAGNLVEQPFLDISERITAGGEQGLLGLAFHPQYPENGRLFVNYTDVNGDTVVSEFLRSDDARADPASERVLFTVDQPFANHNGGMVAFGPDGALYVGMGDGGSAGDPQGNGQNPDTLLGKMVRVDVDAAPGQPSEPTIWDSGLRNPWRFSFDRQTGDLFIGDVGQHFAEEIDAEAAGTGGRNYGWNVVEGPNCYSQAGCDKTGLTPPVTSYEHFLEDCAVTGGYVYRGTALPGLVGTYIYADYCSGIVRGLDAAIAITMGEVTPRKLGQVDFNVSSFGEDEAGELYIVDHNGRVFAITAVPASPPQ